MLDFDAKKAKEIVDSVDNGELKPLLLSIKKRAEAGESVLHVYAALKAGTIKGIGDRGFRVFRHPSIDIQRDGLYYSIYWD